jgi:hypothetical protein
MQRTIRRLVAAFVAAAALALVPVSPLSAQVNMTGTWMLEVDVQGQVTTPQMTLQQNGTELTGHYTSPTLGETDVTGTVEGSKVSVVFDIDVQGQSATVSYIGTVGADGVWAGDFDLAGLAGGTFSGKKQG